MHEDKLVQLHFFLNEIKERHNEIDSKFNIIYSKLDKLKNTFREYSDEEQQKLLVFCLDTLGFNNIMFYYDLEKVKGLYQLLLNRIYGDLYKFYNLLVDYINKSIVDKVINTKIKNNSELPKYNNIKSDNMYKSNDIINIYQIIIELLESINEYIKNKNKTNNNKNMYKEFNDYINIYNDHVNIQINKINVFFKYIIYISSLHIKYIYGIIDRTENIIDNLHNELNNNNDENDDGIFDMKDIEIKKKKRKKKRNKNKNNNNNNNNKNNDNDNDNNTITTIDSYEESIENT
jgi:hypothetical protein